MSIIKDPSLAKEGLKKIDWVRQHEFMPVLTDIAEQFAKERPFEGMRVFGKCLLTAVDGKIVYTNF